MKCPCCKQDVPKDDRVRVDLYSNQIVFDGKVIRVQPKQADIAFMLTEKYPESLRVSDLIQGLYGSSRVHYSPRSKDPDEEATARAHMSLLKRQLKTINLGVFGGVGVDRRGYKLDIPTAEIDDRS